MRELVIDVWGGNRGIDLGAWKQRRGVWGVIVKMGGHEYLGRDKTKTYYEDSQRDAHYEKAVGLGLNVGAYYYGSATTVDEALKEAQHLVGILGGRHMDLPVYYDVEERPQLDLPASTLTAIVHKFCDTVKSAGYVPGIYSGKEGFSKMADVDKYALWAAHWTSTWPKWCSTYGMWQQGTMRLSDGSVAYADTLDVDHNWCQIDYPARQKEADVTRTIIDIANEAAEIHYFMCTDPRFGYSQSPNRWGGDHAAGIVTFTSTSGRSYRIRTGSYDCSSSTIIAWRLALKGTKYEGKLNNATYTGDMRAVFVASGLFTAKLSPAKRGDLYLAEGKHVAMCQDGGSDGVFNRDMLSEFNRNERHSAYGGLPGDQDGYESVVRAYYNDGWNTVLHYNGKADIYTEVVVPEQKPGKAVNDCGIGYRAHCETVGWLPAVRDGQTAGTTGYGKRLEAIKITPPDGVELTVSLHIQGIGDKVYKGVKKGKSSGTGSSANDPIMGTVGKSKRIEAMCIRVGRNDGAKTKGKRLQYRVHVQGTGWTAWTDAGKWAGTKGKSKRIEAIQIKFV